MRHNAGPRRTLAADVAGILDGLPTEGLERVAPGARRQKLARGRDLCRQGQPADRVGVILQGRAAVLVTIPGGAVATLRLLLPGDLAGELALSGDGVEHATTISALEEVEVLWLRPDDVAALRAGVPRFGAALDATLARNAAFLARGLAEALLIPAESRVLRRVRDLARAYGGGGHSGAGAPRVSIPLSQEEVGRMAGAARATVNRVLRREEDAGTIKLGRGRIVVLDERALAAHAGEELDASLDALLELSSGRRVDEEHRLVTVLIAALELVATPAGADDEETRAALERHVAAARAEIEQHGGAVDRIAGDTMIAVFGAPTAHGDDAERGVRAAQAILSAVAWLDATPGAHNVAARIGVATGRALVNIAEAAPPEGRVASGRVVQEASRLRTLAVARTVLVDDVTRDATRRAIAYRRENGAWLATSSAAGAGVAQPVALVGRDDQLGRLWALWGRVLAERRPRLVTVTGAPGVGKTRLVGEFVAQLEAAGARALRGRSLNLGRENTYAPLAQQIAIAAEITDADTPEVAIRKLKSMVAATLEHQDDELADHLALLVGFASADVEADRQSLFFAARRLVEGLSARRPTVLVFEDVHWADDAMLDLVEALAIQLRDRPVLIVALARPELLDRRPGWGRGIPTAMRLDLDPLDVEHAQMLVGALLEPTTAEARARVVETSGGNPLFIEELAGSLREGRTAGDSLPTTITSAITARLDGLPPALRATLVHASVVGKVFWRGLLARLDTPGDVDRSLGELAERGFIQREPVSQFPGDEQYVFRHALIRDTAYAALPKAARSRLHAAVALLLERAAGERVAEWAANLAHHWLEAGDDRRALRFFLAAAERASRSAAHQEAVGLLTTALDIAIARGLDDDAAEILARRGTASARLGRWTPARADLEEADRRLDPDRVDRRAEVLFELALVSQWLLDLDGCRSAGERSLALAAEGSRRDLTAAAHGAIAMGESSAGNVAASLERFEHAIRTAGEQRLPGIGPALEMSGLTLYWVGRCEEAVARGREALEYGALFGDTTTTIRALGNVGLALASCGRYREAFATFEEARRFGEEYGTTTFRARAVEMCAGVHLDLFDFAAAQTLAEEARELARSLGFQLPVVSAEIDLLFNHVRRGDAAGAEPLMPSVEEAVHLAQGAHGWLWRLRLAQAHAELALARGDWASAERLATDSIERAQGTGRVKYEVAGYVTRAAARRALQQDAAGLADARSALDGARAARDPLLLVRAAAALLECGAAAPLADARAAVEAIEAQLDDDRMRRCFGDAAPVRAVLAASGARTVSGR